MTKPSYTSNQIAPTESAAQYAHRVLGATHPDEDTDALQRENYLQSIADAEYDDPEDDPAGWCDECEGFGSHLFGCPNGNGSEPEPACLQCHGINVTPGFVCDEPDCKR